MDEEIVAIYCLCDDFLSARRHREDPQRAMSDAEVMTTALVAARFFGGNVEKARGMLHQPRYIPRMLSKSRLNRRIHALAEPFETLFHILAERFTRENALAAEPNRYLIDSFPVPVCDNIRIRRCRLYPLQWQPPALREAWLAEHFGEPPPPGRPATPVLYRGYIASKRRYFYGVRVHLLTTATGQPVECLIAAGSIPDVSMLPSYRFDLPEGSQVLGDKGYNDYREEEFLESAGVSLCPARKKNSRRPVSAGIQYVRDQARKAIETSISVMEQALPRHIHAVTPVGFELKVFLFVLAYSISFVI